LVDLQMYSDARFAYERARQVDPACRRIEQARTKLVDEDRKSAEMIFRDILKADPSHVGALCGLAAVSLVASRAGDALRLLQHAQKQSLHLPLIWRGLCQAYVDLNRLTDAEDAARRLVRVEPENYKNWVSLGNVYIRLMRQADALTAFREATQLVPREVRLHLSLGHLYKTLGQRDASERAYRECLRLDPKFSEAYSSLADLKNYIFSDAELAAMQALDQGADGDDVDQSQLHFALARAFEHRKNYATAFEHYTTANARRRKTVPFDIAAFENKSLRVRKFFDHAFFARHRAAGLADASPIFVVGLPRSGSTLIEQILASHSRVEGTFELPNVLSIVREFDHADAEHDAYPEEVGRAPSEFFKALGQRYIAETSSLRSGRPHFIDKMPNNFSHVGLIHAMLPQAIVIDARRHPMDACFSAFKQFFAEGQSFSYSLDDLGRYYRSYLALMDHWDEVLPGRVLRVQYEQLVRDPESNIRRLLAHCGLAFEPACLAFHETKRAVRTASSEQVRQPMYTSGLGYWKHFERQLAPLRATLGDALDRFADLNAHN
jgi:cytochrome c-type biogenesis protein CcmH/NrfG